MKISSPPLSSRRLPKDGLIIKTSIIRVCMIVSSLKGSLDMEENPAEEEKEKDTSEYLHASFIFLEFHPEENWNFLRFHASYGKSSTFSLVLRGTGTLQAYLRRAGFLFPSIFFLSPDR